MTVLHWLYEWVFAPLGLYVLVHPAVRAIYAYYDYRNMLREAHELNPTYFYSGYKLWYFLRHSFKAIPETRAPGYHWYAPGVWEVYEIKAGEQNERAIREWVEKDNQARAESGARDWLRSQWQALRFRYATRRRKGGQPEDD